MRAPIPMRDERGMTLIEILTVLAIVGIIVVGAVMGIGKLRKTDLRNDSAKVAGMLRSAADRAAATGVHHRVVFDLDDQSFQMERCEGKVVMRRAHDEKGLEDANAAALEAQQVPDPSTIGPNGQLNGAPPAQSAPQAVGGATCMPAKGGLGKKQEMKTKRGIKLSRIFVAHLEQPATGGKVTVNFYPQGTAERCVVEIADDDGDVYSLVVAPLTGAVKIVDGEYRRPEEFVTEDSTGKRVEVPNP